MQFIILKDLSLRMTFHSETPLNQKGFERVARIDSKRYSL